MNFLPLKTIVNQHIEKYNLQYVKYRPLEPIAVNSVCPQSLIRFRNYEYNYNDRSAVNYTGDAKVIFAVIIITYE